MKKLSCRNIRKVKDITSQCEYHDEHPGGRNDWNLVSCCQDNGYNELTNKLKRYKSLFPNIPETSILKAMCECCNKYYYKERTHKKYDKCVENKLRYLFSLRFL
jgi:hypothetical protein